MTCIGDKVFVRRHTGEIREGIVEGLDDEIWVQFDENTKPEAFNPRDVFSSQEYLINKDLSTTLQGKVIEWSSRLRSLYDSGTYYDFDTYSLREIIEEMENYGI